MAVDSGAPAGCGDVHGAYTLSNDASSSASCPKGSPGEATVTQSGCVVTIAIPGGGTNTATIDSSNKGTYVGTVTLGGMSVNENCAVSFAGSSMLLDCQLTAAGGSADCKLDGAKK